MNAHASVLTAAGRGAIAVIRIEGPEAIELADAVFRPRSGGPLGRTPSGRPRLGRAGAGLGDEVVAVRFQSDPPAVEFQCHGGTAAVESVLAALREAGASVDAAGSKPRLPADLFRAQALADLPFAPTLRTAEILLDQLHGALGEAMDRLREQARQPLDGCAATLDALIRSAAIGTRLLQGWSVVIAGRPNVGKSRLFNALAGFDRSIVADVPGVTRDVVTVRTAVEGWPVELRDTAGLRPTVDAVEGLGVELTRQEIRAADLVLLVFDRSVPFEAEDRELLAASERGIVVANKSDLPAAWSLDTVEQTGRQPLEVSARTASGVDELLRRIAAQLVPEPPEPGAGVPFRVEHLRSLERARDCLEQRDFEGFLFQLEEMARGPRGG